MAGEISFEQATAPTQRGEVSFEDATKAVPIAADKGTIAKGEISFEDAIGASSLPKETSDGIAKHVDSILNPEPKPVPQRTKQTNAEFDQSIRDEQTPGAIAFRAAKQAGGNVIGSTAGLMDMFSGLLGMAISTGAYMGTRATAFGAGEDNKLGAQAAALSAEHFTPEALSTPFRKVMNHLGYGETYDESSVGQAMQWISKQVESGSRSLSKEMKGVIQPEDVSALANAAMLYFGVKGSSAALRNAALGRENVKWEKLGRTEDAQKYSELTKSFETTPEELHPADRTTVAFDATRDFNKWLDVDEAPAHPKGSIVVEEGYRSKATPGPGEAGVSQIGTSDEIQPSGSIADVERMRQLQAKTYDDLPGGTQPKVAGQWEGPGGTGDVTETTEVPGKMERFKELWRGDRRWTPRESKDESGKADPELLAWIAAGGTTAAFIAANPEKAKDIGLGAVAMAGAVKGKGGMWHPEAVERLSQPLAGSLTGLRNAVAGHPRDIEAGIAEGNIRPEYEKALPLVKWSDRAIRNYLNKHAGTESDPLSKVEIPSDVPGQTWGDAFDSAIKISRQQGPKGEESTFGITPNDTSSRHAITSYLSHVGDYLRQKVAPEKLQQYDLVRAVKETAKWDEELAKKMNSVEGKMEGTVPFKTYPDKFQWVEVKSAEALKREGDMMGHCVGGYCDYVESGETKIYSLRGAKGGSHVTIEAQPRTIHVSGKKADIPDNIVQIKGKQNRAPAPEYLPYVQDFVKSGKWGEVGDLENTGLTRLQSGGYITAKELATKAGMNESIAQDFLDGTNPSSAENTARLQRALNTFDPKEYSRGERGSVDPKLLARMTLLGTGAVAGAYADKDNPVIGAIIGGVGGAIATKAGRVALERWKSSPAEGRAATWLSNKLYTLTKQAQVRQIQALQYLSKIIPPDYKLHAEDIYHSLEDSSVKLSARARELRDLLVRPLQTANAKIRSSLEALGVDVGPEIERDYVHRVPVGQRSSIFEEMEKSYPTGRNLPKTAPSLKEREAYAIQTPSGAREIITVEGGNKFFVHRNGKIVGRGSYKPSSPEIKWGGQDWQKVQATTKEIEAHTEIRYYKDAVGTELDNNVRLSTALRNAQFLNKLKSMPSFGEVAAKFKDKSPADWRSVDIDQLKGYKFAPRVANTLDDFRGEMAKHPAETLGKISRILTGSMFWNPLPHIWNVLDHSIVQRGLSAWVSPQGYTRLWKTVGPAWKAVATQDASYLKFMHEGAGLMYPNVLLRDFSGKVMQQLGQVPEMGAVAKAFGYANPVEMVRRVYALSRKTLWAGNDVIMMQAYFEKQLQGAGVLGAIKQVEKHIPNYRIPDRVAGSRMISQVLQSPFFTAFGRYDYGRLASYGAMIKDAVAKSSSMATRAKALDQMAMLAVMGLVVYPMVLDKVAQAITGDPKAKAGRFGASTIPYLLYEYFHNKQELNQVVRSAMPIGPMLNSALEVYTNRDTFTGGKLFKSGQDAFSFVAKNVSPLYTATRVQQGKVTPKEAAFQSIGVRFPKTAEDLKRARQQKALERALGR